MTLYNIEDGGLFKWRNEVYALVSLDDQGKATVRRYLWNIEFGALENFNPSAEVEVLHSRANAGVSHA